MADPALPRLTAANLAFVKQRLAAWRRGEEQKVRAVLPRRWKKTATAVRLGVEYLRVHRDDADRTSVLLLTPDTSVATRYLGHEIVTEAAVPPANLLGRLTVLGADARTVRGVSPTLIIIDEPDHLDRAMLLDVVAPLLPLRPILVLLGTRDEAPDGPNNWDLFEAADV